MTYLEYSLHHGELEDSGADTLVVPVRVIGEKISIPGEIKKVLGDDVENILVEEKFKGEPGSTILYYPRRVFKRVVFTGVGSEKDLEALRVAVGSAINKLGETQAVKALFHISDLTEWFEPDKIAENIVLTSEITLYDPGRLFKSKYTEKPLKEVIIHDPDKKVSDEVLDRARRIADSVNYTRRIADTPSSNMNPDGIEEEAKKLAEKYNLEIEILHYEDLLEKGLNGIISVGKGGGSPPRLIILKYRSREGDGWDIAFVGKTVTFDAGGLNLKPTGYIEEMKYDKCGGAAVLGTMRALAELGLKINALGVLPVVENLPGPKSYKPKDIIKMYNGLTVEVNNTDAEGRLILADALSYVEKNYDPGEIIDLATLTGACVIALGNYAAGLFTFNDEKAEKLYRLGLEVGERVWRLPLWKEYYEQLKSDVADTSNIGGRPAGAITAAAFLSKFVEKKDRWVHLDIAGVAWVQKGHPKKPYYKNAATGYGVRLLTYYVLEKLK